jgi:preprotein translocase subunit SecG
LFPVTRILQKGIANVLIAATDFLGGLLNLLVLVLGILLIFLVLIQRGKGGGLAGAFGGVGGSSAFGSRAGDLFTRITLILAGVWIVLIMFDVKWVQWTKEAPGAENLLGVP